MTSIVLTGEAFGRGDGAVCAPAGWRRRQARLCPAPRRAFRRQWLQLI